MAPNRRIQVVDHRKLGVSQQIGALHVARDVLGHAAARILVDQPRLRVLRRDLQMRPVTTIRAVQAALGRGEPVVLRLTGRPVTFADGSVQIVPANRDSQSERTIDLVALDYNAKRKAFRVMNCVGIGWGQLGRAWLTRAELNAMMEAGRALAFQVSESADVDR